MASEITQIPIDPDSSVIGEKGAVSLIDEMGKMPCCPSEFYRECYLSNPEARQCFRYQIIHTTTRRLIQEYECGELDRARYHLEKIGDISIPDDPEEITDSTKSQIASIIFDKNEGQK